MLVASGPPRFRGGPPRRSVVVPLGAGSVAGRGWRPGPWRFRQISARLPHLPWSVDKLGSSGWKRHFRRPVPSGFGSAPGELSLSLAVPKVPGSGPVRELRDTSPKRRLPRVCRTLAVSVPPALRLSHHLRFARFFGGFPPELQARFPTLLRASPPSLEIEISCSLSEG